MSHVMIDLETLGTQPGSVILSIGATIFDPDAAPGECNTKEFYVVVNKESSLDYAMTVSESTLEWWSQQSAEARKVLVEAEEGGEDLDVALQMLADFIPLGAKIWSNGANFDQPLLDVAYNRVGKPLPWKYWNSRCYRTVLALYPEEKNVRPATVLAHNALEDAKWQATHMTNVAQLLGLKL